ncbi:UDP-N-acetylmuramoyl-tripeptide--D-alanyl-D-alanine ligase [Rickettsiales bacterium]|nr:UDP-N-acetylmuramoyl-tripeptide--D-alanyl-D-alanine ligase [Rickettsiales bacterium]
MWNKESLEQALKNNIISSSVKPKTEILNINIDSRKQNKSSLFIAIKGENNDGHKYLQQAAKNGAKILVVEKYPEYIDKNLQIIKVKDSQKALIDLATYNRNRFQGKVIGITGSVGKTSTKEMLKNILSKKYKIFANEGNLNNHIGMPLSLANLNPNVKYCILEMGMNHLKEIEFLSKIAKPNISIISNIVAAHIGNFNNEQEIAQAKSEIFIGATKNSHVILNKDSIYYDFLIKQAIKSNINPENIINFSKNIPGNINLVSFTHINEEMSKINVNINDQEINYNINSINEATISNSTIILAILVALKENISQFLEFFQEIQPIKGRGNIVRGIKNIKIIDDSYNANLTSVIAGLQFLSELKKQHKNSRSIAIIGDMLELGEESTNQHKLIAKYIDEFNIDHAILVGNLTKNTALELKKGQILGQFENSQDLSQNIENLTQENDILLIKGSRGMKMELVINNLIQKPC